VTIPFPYPDQGEIPEPVIGDREFAAVAAFLLAQTGISLKPSHRVMVEGRLARIVRASGGDFDRYWSSAVAVPAERQRLVNALTTNTTHFFREPVHFRTLRSTIVPRLLRHAGPSGRLKVWSAASSNGAEAYSVAMMLESMQAQEGGFPYAVLGTDISTDVITEARRAVYDRSLADLVPPAFRQEYMRSSGDPAKAGLFRVAPRIRRHVSFRPMNLMDAAYPVDRDVDVVMLRNVLIYFGDAGRRHVIRTLAGHLRPGGYMLLGLTEGSIGVGLGLETVGPSVFRKPGGG
jgi:Methylase of chemotaxis methyl-accepting proteins